MSRLLIMALLLSLLVWPAGCGSDKDKNINKDKDKPLAPDKKQIAN